MESPLHDETWPALGAWVIGACEPDEAGQIATHVAGCPDCRAEADRLRAAVDWFGVTNPVPPPVGLRERVLSAAAGRRAPGRPIAARLREAYADQAGELAALLAGLSDVQWAATVPRHGTVAGVVAHLAGNDRPVLDALAPGAGPALAPGAGPGHPDPTPGAGAGVPGWRAQSDLLLSRLAAADRSVLERTVHLAGSGGLHRPVREALVQRTFETWIHADDVRQALRLPLRSAGPADLRMILDFGLGLLPTAMAGLDSAHPGKVVHLVLDGPGGGEWEIPLAPGSGGARVAGIVAEAQDFCRLMAGRLPVDALRRTVTGDAATVTDVLRAASRLGCD
ncbi:MAG TPA: maleylpyruvate isomerase family mycothiol-dependent enzyme [Pilimelia sp.]|nr:maleylpyruvate isomerase family mycothiol-dependent enzyme [Pilimelia sp.]